MVQFETEIQVFGKQDGYHEKDKNKFHKWNNSKKITGSQEKLGFLTLLNSLIQ